MISKLAKLVIAVAIVVTSVAVLKAEDVEMKGTYLKDEYIKIPGATNGFSHISPTKGTIEFWIKPDWNFKKAKSRKDIFFWGKWGNNNAISFLQEESNLSFIVMSAGFKWLPVVKQTYKLQISSSKWIHVAMCWDVEDIKKNMKIFVNGSSSGLLLHWEGNPEKWKVAEEEFDEIKEIPEEYIYIGAAKYSNGIAQQKGVILNDTVSPDFEISQLRISDMIRYETDEFIPKENFTVDEHTILYIPFKDNLEGKYYQPKKSGNVIAEKVQITKSKK
jgi:hypothetical protein